MKKKKSLWLHFSVYLIIALLMFSVIGVVVIYLNGIQTQQAQYEALYENTTDVAAPIDIAPLPLDEAAGTGTNEVEAQNEDPAIAIEGDTDVAVEILPNEENSQ